MGSTSKDGNNGSFRVPNPYVMGTGALIVIASDGLGWDHVSVSLKERCPSWAEMEYIKRMFWEPEDAVFQLHPPLSEYINKCATCLHMWRNQKVDIERPPLFMVG